MSQLTPPGWYPEGDDQTRLRYWDGTAWTDARTPLAPAPVGVPQPEVPETTQVNTIFAWIFALLPVISIIFSIVEFSSINVGSLAISENDTAVPTNPFAGVFDASSLIGNLVSLLLYAAAVVLALFDHRALTRIGIVRPFHWAFAFIPVQLVYMIGRTVVLRRRVHRGQAPLIAHIIVLVVYVIVLIVVIVSVIVAIVSQVGASNLSGGLGA